MAKKNRLSERFGDAYEYDDMPAPVKDGSKKARDSVTVPAKPAPAPVKEKPVKAKKKESLKDRFGDDDIPEKKGFFRKEKEQQVITKQELVERQAEIEREVREDFAKIKAEQDMRERRWKLSATIFNVLLVAACIYILFLIYGVFVTQYAYNDKGVIKPQIMTVDDIRKQKAYEKIMVQYEKCRLLYEEVLMLNYRLGEGVEDPLVLAPEYESLLESKGKVNVSDLAIKLNALDVDPQYSTLKGMLQNWISNDTALYLQYISAAIATNDGEKAALALQYKDMMYNDFSIITQNFTTIGDTIKGVDITDMKEWSPEKYIDEEVNGKK